MKLLWAYVCAPAILSILTRVDAAEESSLTPFCHAFRNKCLSSCGRQTSFSGSSNHFECHHRPDGQTYHFECLCSGRDKTAEAISAVIGGKSHCSASADSMITATVTETISEQLVATRTGTVTISDPVLSAMTSTAFSISTFYSTHTSIATTVEPIIIKTTELIPTTVTSTFTTTGALITTTLGDTVMTTITSTITYTTTDEIITDTVIGTGPQKRHVKPTSRVESISNKRRGEKQLDKALSPVTKGLEINETCSLFTQTCSHIASCETPAIVCITPSLERSARSRRSPTFHFKCTCLDTSHYQNMVLNSLVERRSSSATQNCEHSSNVTKSEIITIERPTTISTASRVTTMTAQITSITGTTRAEVTITTKAASTVSIDTVDSTTTNIQSTTSTDVVSDTVTATQTSSITSSTTTSSTTTATTFQSATATCTSFTIQASDSFGYITLDYRQFNIYAAFTSSITSASTFAIDSSGHLSSSGYLMVATGAGLFEGQNQMIFQTSADLANQNEGQDYMYATCSIGTGNTITCSIDEGTDFEACSYGCGEGTEGDVANDPCGLTLSLTSFYGPQCSAVTLTAVPLC